MQRKSSPSPHPSDAPFYRIALLAALTLPTIPIIAPTLWGAADYRAVLRPSGLFAAQLIILALMITPLRRLWPRSGWIRWFERQRRAIGVAAFSYAMVHAVFFTASIGRLDHIVQGLAFATMWTGWLALLLLVPLAATSNNWSMRLLGPVWKRLHRLIYPVSVLVLAHWIMLVPNPLDAFMWCVPLIVLQAMRIVRHMRSQFE